MKDYTGPKFLVIAALMACVFMLTGCSDTAEKEAAINSFLKACSVPIEATMVLGSYNNVLTMRCPALDAKALAK